MTEALLPGGTAARRQRRRVVAVGRSDGERLALVAAATTVALLPLLAPRGPSNSAPLDLLIAAAVWLVLLWVTATRRRCRFPYVVASALFLVGGAVGALAGPVPMAGATALLQEAVLFAWCVALVNVASTARRLDVLLRAWVVGSVVWATLLFAALAAGVTVLTGVSERNGSRTALTFGDPNVAATYFFLSLMLVWATGYPRRPWPRAAAYAVLLAALVSTGSNEGLTAVLVAGVVGGLAALHRRVGASAAFTAFAFVAAAALFAATMVPFGSLQEHAASSRYAFVRDGIGRFDDSQADREALLAENLGLYRSGSILGTGPTSTKARLEHRLAPFAKEAHNDYLAALNERGALGLLAVLLLAAGVVARALAVNRGPLRPDFAAAVGRPYALLGAVAGTLTGMAAYELLHVRHVWAFFALVAAIHIWGIEPEPRP